MTMVISAAGGGGETNSFRNNDNVEYKKGMAFNMFKPSNNGENITPSKDITVDDISIHRNSRKVSMRGVMR